MAQRFYLLPDALVQTSGVGPVVDLGSLAGRELQLIIDISRVQERESLDLELWGSPDGVRWGNRPVAKIPRKYHCGACRFGLDLQSHPHVQYVRIEYRLNVGMDPHPLASLSVTAEAVARRVLAAAY